VSGRVVALAAVGVMGLLTVMATGGGLLLYAAGGASGDVVGSGLVRPVDGAVISQGFGCTTFAAEPVDPGCPSGHFHTGVDLAAPLGTPVRATLAGVAHVEISAGGFGLHIVIDHGDGFSSLYGHLSAVAVSDGEQVAQGEVIGAVGSTGNSTGPHLHFELDRDGVPEDPLQELALP
jgi:murein DD-endopeptidase MepM/ murein hydrolase activator NlpD